MTHKPYSGVFIPREVLLDADISASGKIIFAIIQSLDNDKGCFASNMYIGKMLGLSESSVRSCMQDLEKKHYITRNIDDSGNRTIRTCTTISLANTQQISGGTPAENNRPPQQKTGTYSNNDNNSDNKEKIEPVKRSLPHGEVFAKAWEEWIVYRKQLKKPLTPLTISHQLINLSKTTEQNAVNAINKSIHNGWISIFPDTATNSKYGAKAPLTASDHESF
jgi:biotin operon repressor